MRFTTTVPSIATGLLIGLATTAPAQTQAPMHDAARFRVSTDLVLLNVTVGEPTNPVGLLTADRFEVLENGVPQEVTFFAGSEVPKDVAIVLDTSSSMTDTIGRVQDAAVGFLETLAPGDRVTVVGVGNRITTLHPLTDRPADAAAAIRRAVPRGNTALYNGIYATIADLAKHSVPGEVRRSIITVFSDGEDTASLLGIDDVLDVARRSGITIYTIAFDHAGRTLTSQEQTRAGVARFGLKALASETGARSFFLTGVDQVAATYREIASELDRQYSLGYLSNNPSRDGAFRRLLVRLKGRPARTRTRAGYYAPGMDR